MKLYMCAVFDSAVGAYMTPMFFRSPNEAIRSFTQACADGKSVFVKSPGDYRIDVLGVLDDANGSISVDQRRLITADQVCATLTGDRDDS